MSRAKNTTTQQYKPDGMFHRVFLIFIEFIYNPTGFKEISQICFGRL